jgi:hypothetical protein
MPLTTYDRTKADVNISASGKISAPAKLPRLWNFRAYQNSCGKVLRPLTIWARQNLQLLTSSKSGWRALVQILVGSVASRTCRPQVIWRLRPLCFYGRCLSCTVPACCTCTTCQNFCGCAILCARGNFHHFLWKIKNSISASKCPKIRTWSLLLSKFSYHTHRLPNGGRPRLWARLPGFGYNPVGGGGGCGGGGGDLPPPANPDNVAAGGATDARCREGGSWRGEGGDMKQITAHSNPYSSFSLSFCPLCIRRGFDKNFARGCAEQLLCIVFSLVHVSSAGKG